MPTLAELGPNPPPLTLWKKLQRTWPARLAESLYGAVKLPGDVYSGKTPITGPNGRTNPEVIDRSTDLAGLVMGGTFAGAPAKAAGEAVVGAGPIRAYHGSPHDFDRFDLSKIGTGEGAQAYGHGLYFAEREGVAREYRDALAGKVLNPARNQEMAELARIMSEFEIPGKSRQYRDPRGSEAAKRYDELMEARAADKGRMYEVNIHADPAKMLDWDKPLAEQGQHVRNFFESRPSDAPVYPDTPGQHLPGFISPDRSIATRTLREAGIPGIKYLDQGSRQVYEVIRKNGEWGLTRPDGKDWLHSFGSRKAAEAEAKRLNDFNRTSNYVMFDDSLIEILRKYGLAGVAAPTVAYGAQQSNASQ